MRKVLLVGWDAADWKVINPLMDAGKMPNVQRLVENGSMAQIATLQPPLSPMLWTSIATGQRPFKHGIHGFSEPTPDGCGIQPVTNLSRTSKAVWNIFTQSALRSVVIGWWPSHPAEPINGVMVSDHYHRASGPLDKGWPLLKGAVHPPELAETLAGLRMHPQELAVPMVEAFVPKLAEIDRDKDRRLGSVMKTLCECVSIHSCATWLLENQPWDFFAVYFDAIDHFCHGFMRYRAPRQAHISERDFELYQHVVTAGYQLHDMMLGTLLEKAGKDVTVILMSDHGFHPDHLRPKAIPRIPAGPAIEHRDFGILAISGPGIKRDELLHGASVLDITPTLLALYGLPTGADMDGKVLTAAFEEPPEPATIPSWEDVPGADGRHPPHTRLDPVAARESLEQLVALGYIARPGEDMEKAVADTVRELRYNLGEAYQDADRHAEALEIFRELYRTDPDEQRYAVHLFVSCQAFGHIEEMRAVVDDLDGRRRGLFVEAQARVEQFHKLARQRAEERKAARDAAGVAAAEPEAEAELGDAAPDAEAYAEPGAPKPGPKPEPLLTAEERKEFAYWQNLTRFQPPVIDYLKAQILTRERRYADALDALERVTEADLARPGLFLQTAELYGKLHQWEDAERVYAKALTIDPDNAHAHAGMCRTALRRRDFRAAAQSALDAIQRLYHYPMAHFLLGSALAGLGHDARAAEAFRVALSLNPNFPQAHLRLAMLLKRRLNLPAAAQDHLRLFRELRGRRPASSLPASPFIDAETAPNGTARAGKRTLATGTTLTSGALTLGVPRRVSPEPELAGGGARPTVARVLPPLQDEVVVVSGLPRSGTSMIMQMLAAGGVPILTDNLRQPDEDNPRGYFEYEPVKKLHQYPNWISEARGKAVKIVAPLIPALPAGIRCRLIFIERNLEEILASQSQMLKNRGESIDDSPARRARLKEEYSRLLQNVRALLKIRPESETLFLGREAVLSDPPAAAAAINRFLGGNLSEGAMAAEVKPSLHRQRASALADA